MPQNPTYNEAVVDGALAIVTCLVNGNRSEARALAYGEYELHQPGIIEFLAEHVAQEYTPETWREAILRLRRAELNGEA
ncbi:hypothetical protein [Streptomyces bluensis]|uniref:Uncharacterized protein n=1 Tax=Streptomyces bluensis TaxID=33897 RepID=A0ABW6UWB6_9ACTN